MTTENNFDRSASTRGGHLDSLVGAATIGRFGVETTAIYPEKVVKPAIVTWGAGTRFPKKLDTPVSITRKIVKNKLLP